MGLSDITNRQSYIGDGSSTVFPFPHYFFQPSDLIVNLYDINSCSIQAQTLNTHYTVSGNINAQGVYPSGGNVVMNSTFPSNLEIVIVRAPSEIQNFALVQGQPINSLALVQQLDYLTALVQRQQDLNSRSITLPDGVGPINGSSFSTLLPANISSVGSSANMVLAVNSGATGFALVAMGSGGGGGGGGTITGSVSLTSQVSGVLPVANGGTALSVAGSSGTFLSSNGATLSWIPVPAATGSTSLTNQVSGVLPVTNGGTGTGTSYIQYGVMFGSSSTQLANTAQGASGIPLLGQGASAPVFTALSLAGAGVTGTLAVANGGTGQAASYMIGQVIFACSATQMGFVPPGTTGQVLTYQGSSAPTWTTPAASSGSTSLTNQVSGILPIANGGTGVSSLTQNAVLLGGGSGVVQALSTLGAINQVLQGAGGSSAPVWNTSMTLTGGITSAPNQTIQVSGSSTSAGLSTNAGGGTGTLTISGVLGKAYTFQTDGSPNPAGVGVTIADNINGTIQTFKSGTHIWNNTGGAQIFKISQGSGVTFGLSGSGGVSGFLSLATGQNSGGDISIINSGASTGYKMYLPTAQGAANSVQLNDGNGNLSWQVVTNSSVPFSVSSKTATYNATFTDNVILAASGCGIVNLYGVSGNTGREIQIKRTFNGTEPVTIIGSNANIDGTSVVLVGQYESYSMVCDGTNWQVLDHQWTPVSARWFWASTAQSAAAATITWRATDYDSAQILNGSTGIITVNRPGRWLFSTGITPSQTVVVSDQIVLSLNVNGAQRAMTAPEVASGQNSLGLSVSDIYNLNLNDQVTVKISNPNTSPGFISASQACWVSASYLGQ